MTQPRYFLSILVVLALTAVMILTLAGRGTPIVVSTNLENLPMEIAGFHGRPDSYSQAVYDVLNADLNVYRQYAAPDGRALSLYIGYYGTAKGGRTGHNPFGCLPGSGWGIADSGTVTLHPSYAPNGVKLNYVIATREGVSTIILHWYQSARFNVMATGLQQNIDRFMGRVIYNRNDGARVQLYAMARDEDIQTARKMLTEFAQEVLELLPENWPEEV